ncbi:glucose-1-phosphate adenylyltransferase [Planctomicrobium piriforme]|uniref:Glucose-1-phosphate adenylyltransferase n=1 Tax=Planctomicrobium piriforme TaxID=1576369 RepID=A0A1I3JZP8_9PLAN|nr:glucose-1-phosphate adenylyltransferase [Planctomicrobium piriforme]SFI65656.1 glucose-1-phosphate adenylyltransferase [Planctomicrobium piriforme]
MDNVVCFILGGGKGTRLMPLTAERSKPAVPLAGKYRLIDIPISNCINSDLRKIYLLTQFNSVSLHRHIRQTYNFDQFNGGFVEVLAAEQTNESVDWYQGTADAVRKQLRYLQDPGVDYVLILSGDQLYRMDYMKMLETHLETKAEVTIAALPIEAEKASGFGIMRLSDSGRVQGFLEKPKTVQELSQFKTEASWIEAQGIPCKGRNYLASMGIYLFNTDVLLDVLQKTAYHDFGKEVFPASIRSKRVQTHLFDGYWEDIGTIKAFYECNLELASKNPPFEMNVPGAPIFTRPRFLPPTRIEGAKVTDSLIADGCTLEADVVVEGCIVGSRSVIGAKAAVRRSVLMGCDFYEADPRAKRDSVDAPPMGIGAGSVIEGAIVDKNCRIGKNVVVRLPQENPPDGRCGPLIIRDGVIVIPKHTTLPDGWKMGQLEPCKF